MDAIELEEIKAVIRQELASNRSTPRYLPTTEAAEVLGYRDRRQLIRAVESGLLRVGKEVQDRRAPDSDRPSYYFHLEACEKRLSVPPEKRA